MREALAEHARLRRFKAARGLFPIASYAAGDLACFDLRTEAVVFWDHEERRASSLAPSLAVFVRRCFLRAGIRK